MPIAVSSPGYLNRFLSGLLSRAWAVMLNPNRDLHYDSLSIQIKRICNLVVINCMAVGTGGGGAGGGGNCPPNILPTQKIQDCKNNDI